MKVRILNNIAAYLELVAEEIYLNEREIMSFKVIGIFHKKDNLTTQMETFKNVAWHFSMSHNTLFGLVFNSNYKSSFFAKITKEEVIETIYKKLGENYFAPNMKSTILFVDPPLKFHKISPMISQLELHDEIQL